MTVALGFHPLRAEYHYQMAVAIEEDDQADRKRAEMYYERAVEFEPDNAYYRADYGCYLLGIGKRQIGMKSLRKAYALGIHEPEIVGQKWRQALCRRNEYDESWQQSCARAFFRNKGDERFRRLWEEHQYQMSLCPAARRTAYRPRGEKKAQ